MKEANHCEISDIRWMDVSSLLESKSSVEFKFVAPFLTGLENRVKVRIRNDLHISLEIENIIIGTEESEWTIESSL